jgi:translocation protein SEC62
MDSLPLELKQIAKFLRNDAASGLEVTEGITAEKRMDVFKGASATNVLLSDKYMKSFPKLVLKDRKEAHEILQTLLDSGLFMQVSQTKGKFFQPGMSRKWNDDSYYAWIYEGSQLFNISLGICAVIFVISLFMYPLWPRFMKNISWYLMMAVASFVAFILLLAIVRLIVFFISFFVARPGVWLFPNLFADVGFFESFVPLYSWNTQSNK